MGRQASCLWKRAADYDDQVIIVCPVFYKRLGRGLLYPHLLLAVTKEGDET